MSKIVPILITFVTVAVAVAIIFRVKFLRDLVTGGPIATTSAA
jgi:uncharacterized membrane protein